MDIAPAGTVDVPPPIAAALRRVLDDNAPFTLQFLMDTAKNAGGHWRQATWTLEQWRLKSLVVSVTPGRSSKTYWTKV